MDRDGTARFHHNLRPLLLRVLHPLLLQVLHPLLLSLTAKNSLKKAPIRPCSLQYKVKSKKMGFHLFREEIASGRTPHPGPPVTEYWDIKFNPFCLSFKLLTFSSNSITMNTLKKTTLVIK
jgi:hypothetical protein